MTVVPRGAPVGAGRVCGSAAVSPPPTGEELATSPSSRAAVDPAHGLLQKCPAPRRGPSIWASGWQ